jgi:hypothetical protein
MTRARTVTTTSTPPPKLRRAFGRPFRVFAKGYCACRLQNAKTEEKRRHRSVGGQALE